MHPEIAQALTDAIARARAEGAREERARIRQAVEMLRCKKAATFPKGEYYTEPGRGYAVGIYDVLQLLEDADNGR